MTLRDRFDGWYGSGGPSRERHRIFSEALGLPVEIEPNSFLTLGALDDVAAALRVQPGGRLVDVACGRGGVGLWLARHLGADLYGVDFSTVAVRHAVERRVVFGLADRARYWVADQAATGLAEGVANAVLSVDAVQFSPDFAATVREARRILVPGGRYVLTNWQPRDPTHPEIPKKLRDLDLPALLTDAGFTVDGVEDRPDLIARQTAVFEAALASASDDPGIADLRDEAALVAHWPQTMRRLLVTATNPT